MPASSDGGTDARPLEPGLFQQFPQRQEVVGFQLHPQQGAEIADGGERQIQRRQSERLPHRLAGGWRYLAVLHQGVFHDPRQSGNGIGWADEAEREQQQRTGARPAQRVDGGDREEATVGAQGDQARRKRRIARTAVV